MGGRGASSGIANKSNKKENRFSDFEKSLTDRFKRYDYGDKVIFKVGNGYNVYDFKDERITNRNNTLILIKKTLKEAKQAIDLGNEAHKEYIKNKKKRAMDVKAKSYE